jgi:hypothetical protein
MLPALLAPLLLSVALVPDARAGWGSRGCAPVGAPVYFPPVPQWEWRMSADGSRADLYHFGVYQRSHYYPPEEKKPDVFAEVNRAKPLKKDCDCVPSCACGDGCKCAGGNKAESLPRWMTHGTEPEKSAPREEYRVGGKAVSREEALQALQAGQLSDDSQKLRLTVIGSTEEQKQVLAALPADVRDKWLIKAYSPSAWAVKNAGFKTDGHPTVYLQAPGGKVLHRQDDADRVAEAVRRADPNYDPAKDPDLRKPKAPDRPAPAPDNSQNPWSGWVAAGIVALAALLWKGPKQ